MWLSLVVIAGLAACRTPQSLGGLVPGAPSLAARCEYGAAQSSVLVTEWTASDKADFEALMAQGRAVAVAFSGCQLSVVPQCQLGGGYVWERTTPGIDSVEIHNQVDLYTKLPLGAASLSAELARSGGLKVETTVSGQRRLQGFDLSQFPNSEDCSQATHIVNAVSVGAFVMTADGQEQASVSASAAGIGEVGAQGSRSAQVLRSAGDAQACASSTADAPSGDCASPIQVFLTPIPGRTEQPGPPGTIKVDFESASPTARWDVYVDDQATCTTPCSGWVDPTHPVVLRTRDLPDEVRIAGLDPAAGPVQITAAPTASGEFVTGLTFTSLGGMGDATGITLGSIGCFGGHAGLCQAGLITLGLSGAVTAGAIWMMLDAAPRADVRPLFGDELSASLRLTPDGFAGTF